MSKDIDKDKLEELISQLEINIDNIFHLILPNKVEMVGELFPPEQLWEEINSYESDESEETFADLLAEDGEPVIELLDKNLHFESDDPMHNDLLFLNPIKVARHEWIDENGEYQYIERFIEWNPCIDGPYTHINRNNIVSMNRPNDETLVQYLKTVYQLYYPHINDIPAKEKSGKKNVIDFRVYHTKRLKGSF